MQVDRLEGGGGGAQEVEGTSLAIIGLGHVGLPLWLVFSAYGLRCVGVDRNPERIQEIIHVGVGVEEGLREPLRAHLDQHPVAREERLLHALDRAHGAILIAVECESEEALCAVIGEALPWLEGGGLLMIASTCQPGWFHGVVAYLEALGRRVGEDVLLAHTPERLMPGEGALDEVRTLPRVIGGYSPRCAEAATRYYARITQRETIRAVGLEEAALVKIAENAYRAINIVLANEVEVVAHRHGLDVGRVMELANTHPRVALHQPGAGAWGRCLPLAMELLAREGSVLAATAHELNARRPGELVDRLLRALELASLPLKDVVVVVAGLAYKRGQRDTREGAGAQMVRALLERGVGRVRVCDPHVDVDSWRIGLALDASRVQVCGSLEDALQGAHGVVVSVKHEAFEAALGEEEARRARGALHPGMRAPAAWSFVS